MYWVREGVEIPANLFLNMILFAKGGGWTGGLGEEVSTKIPNSNYSHDVPFVIYLSYSRLEMMLLSRLIAVLPVLVNVAVKSLYVPSYTCVGVLVLEMLGCDVC